MMRTGSIMMAAGLLALAAPVGAQSALSPMEPEPSASATAARQDPGRDAQADRGGLSGRGGANPIGSGKTYSATIGSQIYSPMDRTIGSHLPSSPPR